MSATLVIISREDARAAGLKRFYTGKHCMRGHLSEWHVSCGCIECGNELKRKRYAANPEKVRRKNREVRAANPEKFREQKRKHYAANSKEILKKQHDAHAANPEKRRERDRQDRANNPEKYREYKRKAYTINPEKNREQGRKQRAANPERYREQQRQRRANNLEKHRDQDRKRHIKHSEKRNEASRARYAANSEEWNKRGRVYYAANSEEILKQQRQDRIDNPEKYRIASKKNRYTKRGRLCAFWKMIKDRMGLKRGARRKFLYYTAEEFQAHLVSTLPGIMTYEEACAAGYQHDHIVPISYISRNFPFDIACKMVVDLNNLRFIPAKENMQKNSKMGESYQLAVLDILKKKYL